MNELGVVGFGHIGTYIRDMEVSKKFYMDVLGFHVLYECLHEYSGNNEERQDGIFDHLTIEVKDIKKAKEYLEGRGIVFESEIKLDPQLGENGMYYVMFRGPDGEHLQITETF